MDQYDFQADRKKRAKEFFSDAKFTPMAGSPELSKPALNFRFKVFSAVQSLTKPSQRKRNTIFKNGCLLLDQEIDPPNVEEPSFSISSYLKERSGIPMDHALNILNEAENRLAEAQRQWAHDEFPGIVHAAEHPDDREDKKAYQAAVHYNYGDPVYGDPRTIACDITERWYRSIAGELADSATEGLAEEVRSIIGSWGHRPTDARIDDLLNRARTAWMDAISRNLRHNFLAGTITDGSAGDDAKPKEKRESTGDDRHFALRGTPRARAKVRVWIRNYALALEATHQEIERNGSDWRILLSKTRDVCSTMRKRFPGRGQEETGDDPDDSTSRNMERDTMSVAYSAMVASITPLCNTSVAPNGKRAAAVFLDQHGDLTQTAVVSSIVRYAIKPDEHNRNLVGGDVPARPQLVLAWLNLHGAIREKVPLKDEDGKIVTNDDGKVRYTTRYRFPDVAGDEDTPQQDGADDDTSDDDATPAYDKAEDNVSSGSYTRSTIYDTMRVIYAWMQSQHPDIGVPAHPSTIFAPDWRGCRALQAAFATLDRGVDPKTPAFNESLYRYYAFTAVDPRLQTLSNPKRTVVNSYIKAAKAMMRMLYMLGGLGGCTFDSIAMIDVHIDAIEHPASVNVKGRIDASLKTVLFAALATGWTHDPWGSVVGRVRPGLWHHYLDPQDIDTDDVSDAKILPSTADLKGVEDVDRAVRIINGRKRDPLTYAATTLVRVNQADTDAASGTSPAKPSVKNSKETEESGEQRHRRILQLRRDLALHAAEHVICDAQRANLWNAARYAASVDIPGGPDEWSGHDMSTDDYLAGMHERKPYCIGSLNGKVCNYE
ncbi:hypothetical protein [Bifidobacterium vansinderenii]|uniref:Uncharacterized protein n=1 Tax=Bifidobacterium vansinderenii TaxID=1984871 RepID=A0A229VX94_9BIFI|nr:hypothetical protein [Bifidobacterium vansinderenii]OXN00212.1 hypothetical protein Tam10B_1559 [Bifidobacterium vansinderenii]